MAASMLAAAVAVVAGGIGQPISADEIEQQNQNFERMWGTELEWRFDVLPTEGTVPRHRVPYSGYIYPDRAGGTIRVLRRYDRAFHGGRQLAAAFEHHDTTSHQELRIERRGLFGLRRVAVEFTPRWHGHCNGWAAAAIRHAEPQSSVVRKGVRFSPAHIKGLLAELYLYSDTAFLGGIGRTIHPGTLHVVIANWIGRGRHPVAMEAVPGPEKWNYPVFAFSSSHARRSDHVEVKMKIRYAGYTEGEFDKSPEVHHTKMFHYRLELDADGRIRGGTYQPGSARIDFLWVPLAPRQGGTEGNTEGNPRLNMNEVLSIWQESVPSEIRDAWRNIDVHPEATSD